MKDSKYDNYPKNFNGRNRVIPNTIFSRSSHRKFAFITPPESAPKFYNMYAEVLSQNIFIKIVSIVLYISILGHALISLVLTIKSKQAKPRVLSAKRKWNPSHNMGILGSLILLFLILHLAQFWARAKLGIGEDIPLDSFSRRDLHKVAVTAFSNPYITFFYSFMMLPLGFHLYHGIRSSLLSLGLNNRIVMPYLKPVSLAISILLSGTYFIIPILVYWRNFK